MNETPENNEERYKRFRRMLFTRRELRSSLVCGSSSELPAEYILNNPTDVDVMFISSTAVFGERLNVSDPKVRFVIDTEGCHIGFARLKKLNEMSNETNTGYFRKPPILNTDDRWIGPSLARYVTTGSIQSITRSLLTNLNPTWEQVPEMKVDRVYAVKCPCWPPEAAEWITRKRLNEWPTIEIISKVVGLGCHLVPKPHQSNPDDDTQWRFSFSQAEVLLIHSWTDQQRYIYYLLKLINNQILKPCIGDKTDFLCTYYFKTLMLWSCEEKPREFWKEERLESSLEELICLMIEWLIEKRCPNYFISANNMIDYLSEDVDISKITSLLLECKDRYISTLLAGVPKAYTRIPLSFSLPNNVLELVLLSFNNQNMLGSIFSKSLRDFLSSTSEFLPELRYIFNGLTLQIYITERLNVLSLKSDDFLSALKNKMTQENMTNETRPVAENDSSLHFATKTEIDKNHLIICVLSALKDFELATKSEDNDESLITFPLDVDLSKLVEHLRTIAQDIYRRRQSRSDSRNTFSGNEKVNLPCMKLNSENILDYPELSNPHAPPFLSVKPVTRGGACCKNLQDSQFQCFQTAKEKSSVDISFDERQHTQVRSIIIRKLIKELVKNFASPTFLISTGYYANFLYTVLKEYNLAAEKCKQAFYYIENFHTNMDENIIKETLYILLTNEWSMIFDKHVQSILGYLTLCRYVSTNRCCPLVFDISVVFFLEYLYFQSMRKLKTNECLSFECEFKDPLEVAFWRIGECDYSSANILLAAICVSGIPARKLGQTTFSVYWPS